MPTIPPTVRTIINLAIATVGFVLAKLQTIEPTWTWIGIALVVVGFASQIFTLAPAQKKKMDAAYDAGKREGVKISLAPHQMSVNSDDVVTGPMTGPSHNGFVRMPALVSMLFAGLLWLACAPGTGPGPIPAPVITDFAQLVSCIVQNMSSISALLLNCGQWTFAEIEAAIAWLTAHPAVAKEHPEWQPILQARHAELKAKMVEGGAK